MSYTYHPQLALSTVAGTSGYVTVSYYDASGAWAGEQRYKAWGEVRYAAGVMPTRYTYTGQYSYTEGFGLMFYNARWYDPAVGRFAQGDTIVAGVVHGLDRYMYVNNSPLNYNDPSGYIINICGIGLCYSTDLDTIVSLWVNMSTSLPLSTGPGAQYEYNANIKPRHYNLCGDIALQMIYETVTGKTETLGYIYQASLATSRKFNEGTNAYELGQTFAGSFPAGWRATAYYWNYVVTFSAGDKNHNSQNRVNKSLAQYSLLEVIGMISAMLTKGHYVIAGVSQDPGTGLLSPNSTGVGHWVVITAIENGYIYINNPYTNSKQRYSWEYFYGSFQDWILELVPPSYPEMAPSTKSPFGIPI